MGDFKGKVKIGYEYDTNVLELNNSETARQLFVLGWSGRYIPYEKGGGLLSLSLQGFSKIPWQADRADFKVGSAFLQQADIALQKYIAPRIALGGGCIVKSRYISGKTGYVLLQEDSYLLENYSPYLKFDLSRRTSVAISYAHSALQFKRQNVFNYASDGAGISLNHKISARWSGALDYHFDEYRFRALVMVQPPVLQSQRDFSHQIKAGMEHYQLFLSRVELAYERNEARRPDSPFTYNNYQMNAALAKYFPHDISLNIQYAYNIKSYARRNAREINPLDLREKNFNVLTAGISKKLPHALEIDFKYSHISNRTNVSCPGNPLCLDFAKSLFTLTIGREYGR